VCVGAAGGKRQPQAVQVQDLGLTTHDPVLAAMRQRLRKEHGAPRSGPMSIPCVFSTEAITSPPQGQAQNTGLEGNLNCHGYGSSVMVTATFGMVAASCAVQAIVQRH
jgi:tRNA threonylcarbamoyladenosine dehydratase